MNCVGEPAIKEKQNTFTGENLDDIIRIWERAYISLVDVRHALISSKEAVSNYITPSSIFLYTFAGKTEIILEGCHYQVERFGLFHGGKGMELSIQPMEVEYYLIFYKAREPVYNRKGYQKLLLKVNPFLQQYGFRQVILSFFQSRSVGCTRDLKKLLLFVFFMERPGFIRWSMKYMKS